MNSRFDTQIVGYGNFEYDHEDGTLRLSWPGEQMFLSKIETVGLRDFLNQVMPQTPSLAQGTCPNCGLDWTAHSAWIANPGDTTCETAEGL